MEVRLQDVVEPGAQQCQDASSLHLSALRSTVSDSSFHSCRLVSRLGHMLPQTVPLVEEQFFSLKS